MRGCTSDIVGEWFAVGAFGVVVAVPAGFAFFSLSFVFPNLDTIVIVDPIRPLFDPRAK